MQHEKKPIEASDTSSTIKQCPFCYETIKVSATRCPYCGESIGEFLSVHPATPRWRGWKSLPDWLVQIAQWLEWKSEQTIYLLKKISFFELLDYASRLTIIVGIVFWIQEADDRRFQRINQAWQLLYFSQNVGGYQILSSLKMLESEGIAPNHLNLQAFELSDLDLREYNFSGTNLISARLLRADLTDADLSDADLTGADLTGADLTGADLARTTLISTTLIYVILVEANLTGATLTDADLSDADLTGADLTSATLTRATLRGATLIGANLAKGPVFTTIRVNRDPIIAIHNAIVTGTDLTDADLTGADLTSANLAGANLAGANLSSANLSNTVLIGAHYNSSTIWPAAFDPVKAGAIYVP